MHRTENCKNTIALEIAIVNTERVIYVKKSPFPRLSNLFSISRYLFPSSLELIFVNI